MDNNQNINPEHIKIAGEKIQRCVTYIVLQFFLSILFAVILFQGNVGSGSIWIFSILISILGVISLYNLSESGYYLIKSTSNKVILSKDEFSTQDYDNNRIVKRYYANGNLLDVKSYNEYQKKHGIWEYYKEDGSLDFKEVFENGKFIRKIY